METMLLGNDANLQTAALGLIISADTHSSFCKFYCRANVVFTANVMEVIAACNYWSDGD